RRQDASQMLERRLHAPKATSGKRRRSGRGLLGRAQRPLPDERRADREAERQPPPNRAANASVVHTPLIPATAAHGILLRRSMPARRSGRGARSVSSSEPSG